MFRSAHSCFTPLVSEHLNVASLSRKETVASSHFVEWLTPSKCCTARDMALVCGTLLTRPATLRCCASRLHTAIRGRPRVVRYLTPCCLLAFCMFASFGLACLPHLYTRCTHACAGFQTTPVTGWRAHVGVVCAALRQTLHNGASRPVLQPGTCRGVLQLRQAMMHIKQNLGISSRYLS